MINMLPLLPWDIFPCWFPIKPSSYLEPCNQISQSVLGVSLLQTSPVSQNVYTSARQSKGMMRQVASTACSDFKGSILTDFNKSWIKGQEMSKATSL